MSKVKTYNLTADIPAKPLDAQGLAPLQQYTTFRYHAGGVPSFLLAQTLANIGMYTSLTTDVRFRIGLRGANGIQATSTLIWARGERGNRKYWLNTLSGQYAINARLDLSASSAATKTHGSFKWNGTLWLAAS